MTWNNYPVARQDTSFGPAGIPARHGAKNGPDASEIVGESRALRTVLDQVSVVAPTGATVLIQGETGTGKELIARAIHEGSPRRSGPFISLNCGAVPASLIESELFGHERGAFTGAVAQRTGRFELANGGTLFLDEIGEIALELQVKLLRVLQEREFERLGATRTTRVDVRIVAATNRDLARMVDENQFRADLYYRLSVFPIPLPPLRDRRGDIPALTRHFVAYYSERMRKIVDEIPRRVMEAMMDCDWPGNVRELQNFVEYGVIVSKGPEFLPPLERLRRRPRETETSLQAPQRTLDEAARDHILQTLRETNGVVGGRHGAAARLGLARTTLISKMRRLGIEHDGDAPAAAARAFASVA